MRKSNDYLRNYQQAAQPKLTQWQRSMADLKAAGRMGHDEISHVLKAFPDSIPITPEMGAIGEPTAQEVFSDKGGYLELQQSRIQLQHSQEQEQER